MPEIIKFFLGLLLGIVLVYPLGRSSATLIWSEDFSTSLNSDWTLLAFAEKSQNPTTWSYVNESRPIISNGGLIMSSSLSHMGHAERASNVAYGTWSFDWMVEPGKEHESYEFVSFVVNNYPQSDIWPCLSSPFYTHPSDLITGYNLRLISGHKIPYMGDPPIPSISLGGFQRINYTAGYNFDNNTHKFSSPICGSHHIDITRNSQGEFKVFFDFKLIIEVYDNTITTSEKFILTSSQGDSTFDNITVSTEINEPTTTTDEIIECTNTSTSKTTGFTSPFILISVGIFILIQKKRM